MLDQSKISLRNLLCWHFLICSIGLIGLVSCLANILWGVISVCLMNNFINYSHYIVNSVNDKKPGDLLRYIFVVCSLFLYYSNARFIINAGNAHFFKNILKYPQINKIIICLLDLMLNFCIALLFFIFSHGIVVWCILFFIWVGLFFFPFLPSFFTYLISVQARYNKSMRLLVGALLFFLATQLIGMFIPYIGFGKLKIINDYLNIPEQTLLAKGYVNNINYINKHNIAGLNLYNPDEKFIETHAVVVNPRIPEEIFFGLAAFSSQGNFLPTQENLFCKQISLSQCKKILINQIYNKEEADARAYTQEEIDFGKKNTYELPAQLMPGYYFHHQNALLGPMNEYHLGKPLNQIVFLYGLGNSVLLVHLMHWIGDFKFDNYIKLLYTFYPLYYLLVIITAAIIFRNINYVLIAALLCFGSLQWVGFEAIRIAPGFNPLRHFFDLFIIIFFYKYLFSNRHNTVYLSVAWGFALLALIANKEFGLVMFISLSISFFLSNRFYKKSYLDFVIALVIILAVLLINFHSSHFLKADPLSMYIFLGVMAVPISYKVLAYTLASILLTYVCLLYFIMHKGAKQAWIYLALFLFIYLQGILIYFIWNPDITHLLSSPGAIFSLLITLLLMQGVNQLKSEEIRSVLVKIIISLLFIFYYLPGLFVYYDNAYQYYRIFKTHKVYQWNFVRAQFLTTMDPKPFEQSINLINRYEHGPGIYIISKYDNFLPYLAGKYSEMPFLQLDTSIVSTKELSAVIGFIDTVKPKYLFIDTDISDNHFGDVVGNNDPFQSFFSYPQSLSRSLLLNNLNDIFHAVQAEYRPIAYSGLLTVYQRVSLSGSKDVSLE